MALANANPTHSAQVRVEWVDTDAGGRIHHTAAFRWAEKAEHELLRSLAVERLTSFPRRRVEATFHSAAAFGDEIEVQIALTRRGRSSVQFAWSGHRDSELLFDGTTVAVYVDPAGRPTELPPQLPTGHDQDRS